MGYYYANEGVTLKKNPVREPGLLEAALSVLAGLSVLRRKTLFSVTHLMIGSPLTPWHFSAATGSRLVVVCGVCARAWVSFMWNSKE